jgi:hypothetical protein
VEDDFVVGGLAPDLGILCDFHRTEMLAALASAGLRDIKNESSRRKKIMWWAV